MKSAPSHLPCGHKPAESVSADANCRICWLWCKSPQWRDLLTLRASSLQTTRCGHLLTRPPTGNPATDGGGDRHWCGLYGRTCRVDALTELDIKPGDPLRCLTCSDHTWSRGALPPTFLDVPLTFCPSRHLTNPSACWHKGKLYVCAREGIKRSKLWLWRIDPETLEPIGQARPLVELHQADDWSQEDPRLFSSDELLHVQFTRVTGTPRTGLICRIAYGSGLTELTTAKNRLWTCDFKGSKWEKNWQPIGGGDRLCAILRVSPRFVLADVAGDFANVVHDAPSPIQWEGPGDLRGGTVPVLHPDGDRFCAVLHSTDKRTIPVGYFGCWVEYAAEFPHEIIRYSPLPILAPDGRQRTPDYYASVIFPGGLISLDATASTFAVAYGHHDREARVCVMDYRSIAPQLREVAT